MHTDIWNKTLRIEILLQENKETPTILWWRQLLHLNSFHHNWHECLSDMLLFNDVGCLLVTKSPVVLLIGPLKCLSRKSNKPTKKAKQVVRLLGCFIAEESESSFWCFVKKEKRSAVTCSKFDFWIHFRRPWFIKALSCLSSLCWNPLKSSDALTSNFLVFPFTSYFWFIVCPPFFFSFIHLRTDKPTKWEHIVQSKVSVTVTCLWRTFPVRQFCSCRANPELPLWGNRAPPRDRSRHRGPMLPHLLRNCPPRRLLLRLHRLPPCRWGWCSSWQRRWAPMGCRWR